MKSNKLIVIFLIKFFGTYALLSFLYSVYLNNTQKTTKIFACAPITEVVANQSVFLLNSVGYNAKIEQHSAELSMKLVLNNVYILRVIEGCNAVSIIILFISFIISFSEKLLTTVLYIVFGTVIIYAINVIRIAIIAIALYEYPVYQELLHNIIFPAIIYGTTFLLWFFWVKNFSRLKQ